MDESVGKNLVSARVRACTLQRKIDEGGRRCSNEEIEGNIDYARFSVSGKLDFLICTIDPRP